MGGCLTSKVKSVEENSQAPLMDDEEPETIPSSSYFSFQRFPIEEILESTSNFHQDFLLPDGNKTYRRTLRGSQVHIKKLPEGSWDDETDFEAKAEEVGSLNIQGLIPLLGYSSTHGYRVLISSSPEHHTLSFYLFNNQNGPLALYNRLQVAIGVATTLIHLQEMGFPVYYNLSPDKIYLDKDFEPQISCFGLFSPEGREAGLSLDVFAPPEFSGQVFLQHSAESTVFGFGNVLVSLLSGRNVPPKVVLQAHNQGTTGKLIDVNIGSNQAIALEIIKITASCLNHDPRERPSMQKLRESLQEFQAMLEQPNDSDPSIDSTFTSSVELSLFAKAAREMDLDVIRDLLVLERYPPPANDGPPEISLEIWTEESANKMEARYTADEYFATGRWQECIDSLKYHITHPNYRAKRTIPALVHLKNSFCNLMLKKYDVALACGLDAMFLDERCPEPYFLQSIALKKRGNLPAASKAFNKGAEMLNQLSRTTSSSWSRSPSPSSLSRPVPEASVVP